MSIHLHPPPVVGRESASDAAREESSNPRDIREGRRRQSLLMSPTDPVAVERARKGGGRFASGISRGAEGLKRPRSLRTKGLSWT